MAYLFLLCVLFFSLSLFLIHPVCIARVRVCIYVGPPQIKRVLPNKAVRRFMKSKLVRRLLSAIVGFSKKTVRQVKARIFRSIKKAAVAQRSRDRFAKKLLSRAVPILAPSMRNKAKLVFPKLVRALDSKWRFRHFVHTLQAKLESARVETSCPPSVVLPA